MQENKEFSLLDSLQNRFEDRKKALLECIPKTDLALEKFETVVESCLNQILEEERSKAAGKFHIVDLFYNSVFQRLKDACAYRQLLLSLRRICEVFKKRRAPLWYGGLYVILILAAMAIFAGNFELIFPNQEAWIGVLSSLIVAAPSYLVMCEHKRRPGEQFLRHIHLVGIVGSVLMIISFSVTRAFVLLSENNCNASPAYSQQGFLSSSSQASVLDKAQLIAALATFFTAILTEMAFGSRLAIDLAEYQKAASFSVEEIDEKLKTVEAEIEGIRAECLKLGQERAQLAAFNDSVNAWKCAEKELLILQFQTTRTEEQERLRKALRSKIEELSFSELRQLTTELVV